MRGCFGSNDEGPVFVMNVTPSFGGMVLSMSHDPATQAVFAAPGELAQAT
jgi:hypothetical protein